MIGYASRTGTKRNLDALRARGWRLLVSATGVWRTEGFDHYAIDNGAWTAHQAGQPFDADKFRGIVADLGDAADWIVVPDIVGGGLRSLDFSREWIPELSGTTSLLLAVQDGMSPADVEPMLGDCDGVFVGGTTEWKLSSLPTWGAFKRATGCYLHVGRVNSARRIRLCALANADSFDGTSASRYAKTIGLLDAARRQTCMPWDT